MPGAGVVRNGLADALTGAFAGGLLSEDTLSHRLGVLFGSLLIDPRTLVGDLPGRTRRTPRHSVTATLAAWRQLVLGATDIATMPLVLALDWTAGEHDLVLGRGPDCDLRLSDDSVSRRHARLVHRDEAWVIRDLGSTNGTLVNGTRVGRCRLRPGDRIELGEQVLRVD